MFPYHLYDLKRYEVMNKNCPDCGLVFEIEPGFFYGAMYVSYAFSMFILILTGLVVYISFDDASVWIYALLVTIPILILHPVMFRYSRVVFLHLFGGIHYQPNGDK